MTRKLPEMHPPELRLRADKPVAHTRSYRVITPLFGGGVEPQHPDPISVVRASEIRGQLRFWWRATQGGRYGSEGLKKMKEDEDALWGSTSRPSLVQVEVRLVSPGMLITKTGGNNPFFFGDPIKSPISYAAFPLRATSGGSEPGGLSFGVEFQLAVTLPPDPAQRQQVIAALWAWETFGGIGARTRRGFGALHCYRVEGVHDAGPWQPSSSDEQTVQRWLGEHLARYVQPGNGLGDVPLLDRERLPVLGKNPNIKAFQENFENKMRELLIASGCQQPLVNNWLPALVAWYYPIEQMRRFRQSRRNNEQKRPFGRSYWPEPDEIRRRTVGFKARRTQLSQVSKFPRAAFGLPIVFQFKDGQDQPRSSKIDPPQTTLQGAHHDRLASRLILRPLACADGRFVSLALVLNAPSLPPGGLKLEGANPSDGIDARPLTNTEANFWPLNGKPDVLQAFLDTL
ncbi:MAG: type III-B CRISPR module RAMP protein Cmr1 [Chloroflexaceae bacterium]